MKKKTKQQIVFNWIELQKNAIVIIWLTILKCLPYTVVT